MAPLDQVVQLNHANIPFGRATHERIELPRRAGRQGGPAGNLIDEDVGGISPQLPGGCSIVVNFRVNDATALSDQTPDHVNVGCPIVVDVEQPGDRDVGGLRIRGAGGRRLLSWTRHAVRGETGTGGSEERAHLDQAGSHCFNRRPRRELHEGRTSQW